MPVDDLRQQLELRLRGELLREWCRQLADTDESVTFDDGWCSGQRVIRFCTRAIDALVGEWRGSGDVWGLGRLAFYELENDATDLRLSLCVSKRGLTSEIRSRMAQVLDELQIVPAQRADEVAVVHDWSLAAASCTANEAVAAADATWWEQVVPFERVLSTKLLGDKARRMAVPAQPRARPRNRQVPLFP